MRHYRWTQIGMEETTFAVAEPDTYVKSLDMGTRVDEVKRKEGQRIRRELLRWAEVMEAPPEARITRANLEARLDLVCPEEG